MPQVFLSHAGSDDVAARRLKDCLLADPSLRAVDLNVWLDKDDLIPGTPWKDQIQDVLGEASACLVVVGETGVVNWVAAEVDIALSRAVEDPTFKFIPVLLGVASSSDLMPFARRYHAVYDPLSNEVEFDKLVRALRDTTDREEGAGKPDLSPIVPYPGLRSMDESWSDRFFGRDKETRELLGKLKHSPVVSIVAASGAGKSSLAMAGLAAAWRGGAFHPSQRPSSEDPVFWNVLYVRPGANALEGLRQAVQATAAQLGRSIAEQTALRGAVSVQDASSSLFAMECALPAGQVRTLMVVDQAEELVTATRDAAARAQFGQLLRDMAVLGADGNRLRIVLTMRDDYANRVHNIPGLDQHARNNNGIFKLSLPKGDGLRAIIEEPLLLARVSGRPAIDEFTETVLKDVVADRAGDMALLQMALHLAWRDREKNGGLANAYRHLGGISGALGQEAERIGQEELSESEKALLMPVFMRLVRLGETSGVTRRIAPVEEFTTEQKLLIDRLSGEDCGRLLQVQDKTVEIAHESLISQWPELAQQVEDNNSALKTLSALTTATDRWKSEGLLRRRLASRADVDDYAPVQTAHPNWLSTLETVFLHKSKAHLRLIRAAVWSGIFAVALLAAASGLLFLAASQANTTATENRRMAIALLAQRTAETLPDNAIKLVLSSWPQDRNPRLEYAEAASNALSTALANSVPSRLIEGHIGSVDIVALSPDGTLLLSDGEDGTLRLWNAQTGAELRQLKGHDGFVMSVAFSTDGTRLLAGEIDGTLLLWDVETGAQLSELSGHINFVNSVAFSPDDTRLLSGGYDGTLRLWDAETGAELRRFGGYDGPLESVAFSPDGTRLISGGADRTLRVWDAETGAQLRQLEGHDGPLESVAFSPDGTRLLSTAYDGTLRIWDVETGAQLSELNGHHFWAESVAFSPDGTRLLAGGTDRDGTLRLWDAETGAQLSEIIGHGFWANSVAFSTDGTRLLAGGRDGTLRLWIAEGGARLRQIKAHETRVTGVAFSPDGTRLLSGGSDGSLRLWDAKTGAQLRQLEGHDGPLVSVAFGPDGTRLLSGSRDDTLRLWDAETGTELRQLEGSKGLVRLLESEWEAELRRNEVGDDSLQSVAFSPDGTLLLSGGMDPTLRLWDAKTGAQLRQFEGHETTVSSVVFSPDGTRLLSGGTDNTMRVWDAETGAQLRQLEVHHDWVYSVAFSPDGTRLLAGGTEGTLQLWDAETGTELHQLEGHDGAVFSVAFSPDGTRLLSGGEDGTLRLWDAETGTELHQLEGHDGGVNSVAFSPDGTRLLSGGEDGTLRLQDAPTIQGSILQVACAHLPMIGSSHDRDVAGLAAEIGIDTLDPIPPCKKYDPPMPIEWQVSRPEKQN